ncbi:PREDICTED: uncharacterized protein LOC104793364 isoform X1 [Camelina sativa]|uniref:Uncharacterized protein LOC104793364 isoform X1 n=1 Tax=Camelina sativa TaxID=90675 RepID=A0ABM0ZMY1_CAMSA|nr:PREDICTED: uncharacterized protein LOC104793364 isoform X1 [Camelina sativa]
MMGMAGLAVALMVITSLTIATCADGKDFFHHPEIKVRRFLKQLNKPALKSIKSEDGDIIDCVPIAIQPDFDHPSLINHTIQIKPSFIPEGEGDSTYTKKKKKPTQVWHKDGEYCPENTVPIRRTKKEDILRAKSLESFGKKSHQYIPEDTSSNPNFHHELETYLVGYWPSFIVPKLADSARKIVWGGEITHYVEGRGEHTLPQMGSGHFAEEGFKKAAYFNCIEYIDKSNNPITPFAQNLEAIITRPECYNLKVGSSRRWGAYIFYGGPGHNPQCL